MLVQFSDYTQLLLSWRLSFSGTTRCLRAHAWRHWAALTVWQWSLNWPSTLGWHAATFCQ